MQFHTFLFISCLVTLAGLLVDAQTGPFPSRLSIPGAVPISTPLRSQYRNEKLVRVRRPTVPLRSQNSLIPATIPARLLEDLKPVTESGEDDSSPDVLLPQLLREQQLAQAQQAQFHQTASAFFNSDPNEVKELPIPQILLQHEEPSIPTQIVSLPAARFPERSQPISAPLGRPAFNDYGIGANFRLERPQQPIHNPAPAPAPVPQAAHPAPQQPHRVNVVRSRPVYREPRPQFDSQPAPLPAPAPSQVRPRPRPIQPRPSLIDQNQIREENEGVPTNRRQRPVAQTIRKWREENEDGSISWGYENDDGSFKDEIIGTDCITKGTYGYIDPDGNKREYQYETGIKCDPNTRETEEELEENGFVNYEENKAVLPNGIEIDMTQLGKKKSKRPNGAAFRN